MRNKILNRLYVLSVLAALFCSCSSQPEYKPNSQLYPLMDCLMHTGWMGLGDSTAEYTQDSILFRGLKVEGKSFEEVSQIYGAPSSIHRYETFFRPEIFDMPEVYPITYHKGHMFLIRATWDIPNENCDDIQMTVFFEDEGYDSKAIYGYQFNYSNILPPRHLAKSDTITNK